MIITKIEPVKLRYYPQKPLRDGLARIPSRDVFLLKIETDEEIYGIPDDENEGGRSAAGRRHGESRSS